MNSLKVYCGGIPLASNAITSTMNLEKKYGEHHLYLYDNMVQTFGEKSLWIGPESFYKDCFIFCIPIQGYYYGNNYAVARENKDRKLNFLSIGGVDLDISFSKPLPHNVICNVIGVYDLLNKFGPDGAEIIT